MAVIPDDSTIKRIAFSRIKGISMATAGELLRRVGSPERFFELPQSALASLSGLDSRVLDDAYRRTLVDSARREAEFTKANGITVRFCTDDNYPRRMLECEDAPALLYSIGTCDLDIRHSVAIVGTRHATAYGLDFVKHLVRDLADMIDDLVIVSGLAYGIDVAAHRAALDCGVPTVAVMAHGLNTIYPSDHRSTAAKMVAEGGAIVTEYASDAAIHRGNFLARNRIVAGLADAVVVVESDIRGGALATARIASAYNREVFAVPGRTTDTYSRGCNALVANHTASVIRSAEDLTDTLGWVVKSQQGRQTKLTFEMSDEQQSVVNYINAHPDHTINDISVGLGIPYKQLASLLFEMEMSDMLITLPGGRYSVIV